MKATSTLSGKVLKALHSLFAITKDGEIPLDLVLGLFDTFVGPIPHWSMVTHRLRNERTGFVF